MKAERIDPRPIIRLDGVTKRFPGVVANDRVSIDVRAGEVVGLVGENGAGKTTLMNILYGFYRPDEGRILIDEKETWIRSPQEAMRMGIGMVHQHFTLVRTFSVAENLVLGMRGNGSPFLRMREIEEEIAETSRKYGLEVDPRAKIWQLSVGEQQRVEILSSLLRQAKVIVFDEPTAVLTPQESDALFRTFRALTSQGRSVIFITHKLGEAISATDRITVLRRGRVVATRLTSETTAGELARLMVGRDVLPSRNDEVIVPGEEIIRVKDLWVRGDNGLHAVKGLSFSVRRGEILGIAGVDGNGQRELCEALVGLRSIETGQVEIKGITVPSYSSRKAIDMGVGHIPEDRQRTGLVLNFPVWRNAVLRRYRERDFCQGLWLRLKNMVAFARGLIKAYDLRIPSERVKARVLSGGNQQKLVLARELSSSPDLLVANQPTRGLDIAATEYVHSRLLENRRAGRAIVLVSRELTEILDLSDRVAVMYEGKIVKILPVGEANVSRVGFMMAGLEPEGS